MHSRSFFVAFLTLVLSSFTAHAAPASNQDQSVCSAAQVQTVYQTVTVTASSASSTSSNNNNNQSSSNSQSSNGNNQSNDGNNQSNDGNNQSNNGNGQNSGNHNQNSSSSSSSSNDGNSVHQSNVDNNNNGKNNTIKNPSSTTTSSAAASTETANTANSSGNNASQDASQTSLTLDPRVIAKGFTDNGQDVPTAGQVASLTSTNNFINFCLTVPNLPITDGKQITTGSCNPAPIGVIPSTDNMPSAKFTTPKNFATLKANTAFQIEMNIQGMETGFFVNADENYFAAPQQLNAQGLIKGHSHVVIEELSSLEQGTPTDPKKFAFFKGLNSAAIDGKLTADVSSGLPVGVYRLASINTNANHAPAIVPIAQHGSLDDMIYFSVTADGKPVGGGTSAPANSSTTVSSTLSASSVSTSASASGSLSKTVSASKTASTSKTSSASRITSTSKTAFALQTASASETTSTSKAASASETTSASVTGTVSATVSAVKVSSSAASSPTKVSIKASSTAEATTSASTNESSAAVVSATEKATADVSPKATRDLRFRRRWNLRK